MRVTGVGRAVLVGLLLRSMAGCSGDTAAGTAATDGGVDGRPQCYVAGECDDANPCTLDACTTGACTTSPAPDGDAKEQTPGDCQRTECKAGVRTEVPDSGDVPDDHQDCTLDTCTNGIPQHQAKLEDSPCTIGVGSGTCKGGVCLVLCTPNSANSQCDDLQPCTEDACLPCSAAACQGKGMCANQGLSGMPTPGAPQTAGDCHEQRCVEGADKDAVDNYDVPVDGNECTEDVCRAGVPVNEPTAAGTTCSGSSGYVCDGKSQCVQCLSTTDCTDAPAACSLPACKNGSCTRDNLPAGTPLPDPQQTVGDCRRAVCDGAGGYVDEAADDVYDDGNPCTTDGCAGMNALHTPLPTGTACGSGRACSASGTCCAPTSCAATGRTCGSLNDGCGNVLDCGTCDPGDTCGGGTCGCKNSYQSGSETDVDCGGGACPACVRGKYCAGDADCGTGHCVDGVCCDSACAGACQACDVTRTGVANGTCADVYDNSDPDDDCAAEFTACGASGQCLGGACEYPAAGTECAPGSCSAGVELSADTCDGSGLCVDNGTRLCSAPYACSFDACQSCADGVQNGNETDVDCGGDGACADCTPGKRCNGAADCLGGSCVDGVCCSTACGGLCEACNGSTPGVCSPLPYGADPLNECAGPKTCNGSGGCN